LKSTNPIGSLNDGSSATLSSFRAALKRRSKGLIQGGVHAGVQNNGAFELDANVAGDFTDAHGQHWGGPAR
jgi:hypothetical protein